MDKIVNTFQQQARYFFLLILISCWNFFSSEAKQITVSNHQSIKKAVTAAASGDTIFIAQGTYREHGIEINIPLTIIGEKFPVIDGEAKGQIFTIHANDVTIKGLQIQNTGYSAMNDLAGVRTQNVSNINVIGNKFLNCCYAIFIAGGSRCTVENNSIKGNPIEQQLAGNGIHSWQSTHCEIRNNNITGQRDGIYFEFVFFSVIENNRSYDNMRYGLHFMFSDNNRFEKNIFERNGAGVAVMYSKYITMLNNIYSQNWGGSAYGLLLKDINDSYVLYNHFEKNTAAINMEGCNRSVFLHNDFIQNGWAMRVQANCENNIISFNNFIGNTFDVATNGSLSLNYYSRNYWDKYDGYDLNRDGVGDVPYRPVSVFSMISENIPESMIMMQSFSVMLLDKVERVLPGIIPEGLIDNLPLMKKNNNAYPDSKS